MSVSGKVAVVTGGNRGIGLCAGAAALLAASSLGCNAILGIEGGLPGGADVPAGMVAIDAAGAGFSFSLDGSIVHAKLTHGFAVDRDEVTVGRFKAWLDAGREPPCGGAACSLDPGGPYEQAMTWNPAWNDQAVDATSFGPASGCTSPVPYGATTFNRSDDALPMTCVSWLQANAFCAFEGKRLPTETEWEFVATGHGDGRAYPFAWKGEPLSCDLVTFLGSGDGCGFPVPTGTASKGASRDGIRDLAGSVFEWVWDAYATFPDDSVDHAGPQASADPAEPKVRHGGAYISPADDVRLTNDGRENYAAYDFYSDAGFRCAKTLP